SRQRRRHPGHRALLRSRLGRRAGRAAAGDGGLRRRCRRAGGAAGRDPAADRGDRPRRGGTRGPVGHGLIDVAARFDAGGASPRYVGYELEGRRMAEITAALVKELRETSGAGMMDCKRALTETAGNLQDAVDWLRKKGLAAAAKKAGRVAAEGLIGVATSGTSGAVVEVNSETDFVARNESFQGFVGEVAGLALTAENLEALRARTMPGEGKSVAEKLTQLVGTIGENVTLRRMATLSVKQGL